MASAAEVEDDVDPIEISIEIPCLARRDHVQDGVSSRFSYSSCAHKHNKHASKDDSSFFTQPTTGKRASGDVDDREKKRAKLSGTEAHTEVTSSDSESDVDMEETWALRSRVRKRTVFGMRDAAMMATSFTALRSNAMPTRIVLQSFVSSHKTDVFRCYSADETSYNTLPYACAYSNAAKSGSTPLLAIATEQGSVHVVNTRARHDWDCEPPRTILAPHANGIFDIKWSPSDTLLAPRTVKCVAWDPEYDGEVLARAAAMAGSVCGTCVSASGAVVRAGRPAVVRAKRRGDGALKPVISIPGAHEDGKPLKPRGRKGKRLIRRRPPPMGPPLPTSSKKTPKSKASPKPILISADPTTLHGVRRARGITTLIPGTGPSAGHLFALGTDARVHTFALPSLQPLSGNVLPDGPDPFAYTHDGCRRIRSTCARALAVRAVARERGHRGRTRFLFDVGEAAGRASREPAKAVC
ncbi:uncharacterized protein B0H18DRAFT_1112622 [Fomitopsis serialis]|uniref:uncharacterized protein n=1 Tax=Fomitopsis serialis TaxID=139415 RepID=UPI002008B22E|nr:uncharacterized protein B0H18DRAFT_1112622 [Neoantrodia serialis]KAH9938467.1 hypothetical protein B0H18DRAFT_1112622 [Neoantrodia serialis]